MKYFNVPAINGIPGIMPGIVELPLPQEVENDEEISVQRAPRYINAPKTSNTRKMSKIPKHRRMMPCDRKDE